MMLEQAMENLTLDGEIKKYEGSPMEVYIQILRDMEKQLPEEKVKEAVKWVEFHSCKENSSTNGENAIYLAICSGNVKLLDRFICECDFFSNSAVLDSILSVAYCRIKLNNVLVSEEMDLCVQYKLIKLRFYSEDTVVPPASVSDIEERLNLVLEKIAILLRYSTPGVDETFLYIAKFIVKNLYVLKQQLKTTYSTFPWEEIVFCLLCFISAHTKKQELNIFFWSILTKESILKKLKIFSESLQDWIGPNGKIRVDDVGKLNTVTRTTREDVIAGILKSSPSFKELYDDYTELRDIYSLDKISHYINAALLANRGDRGGQLTIKRALQVMGEELKNTLESPNLSTVVSDLLLLSAPLETRQVLTAIRNSLSHAHILTDMEGFEKLAFYTNIHNDLKKVSIVISQILSSKKINKVKSILSSIKNSDNFDKVNEILDIFKDMSILDQVKISPADTVTREERQMEEIFNIISNKIGNTSEYEKELLTEIKKLFNQTKSLFRNVQQDYSIGFGFLKTIFHPALRLKGKTNKEKDAYFKVFKRTATEMLSKLPPPVNPSQIDNFGELSRLLGKLYESAESRIPVEVASDIRLLIYYIQTISICDKDRIKWIDEFKECLGKHKLKKVQVEVTKGKGKGKGKKTKEMPTTDKEEIDEFILKKLSELKDMLKKDGKQLLKINNTKRFMMEALFLDILSDLDTSKCLVGNILFVDDAAPLLTGRCLRNYLAHGNPLVDIFFPDTFTAIFTNAEILTESALGYEMKIGQIVQYDSKKLKENFEKGLNVIDQQGELRKYLREENLGELKRCLREGACTNYRSMDLWTMQHFAAQGPSLKILKFLIRDKHLDPGVKECNYQSLLHVASASGRHGNVEYLVQKVGLPVNEVDGSRRTPLHLAAKRGHKEAVETLLRLGAEEKVKDWCGFAPLHYAVRNNRLNVVQILSDENINYRESSDGFSPLHIAADFGHAEILEYLVYKGADIDDKAYTGATPLYFAALNGHLEAVRTLINKGANVNMKGLYSGCTPLNNAAEHGHEDVVSLLLTHNASVSIGNRALNQTPIQCASYFGHKGIVELLIKYKANVNAVRYDGLTPLMSAALNGHGDIVDLLLRNDAKVGLRTFDGSTALHLSALRGHNGVVKSLLRANVEFDCTNDNKLTALHEAVRSGNLEVVKTLAAAGCNVNCRAAGGLTPLHISASKGYVLISEALLKMGASVDSVTTDNYSTPLNESLRNPNNKETVRLLLANGASLESKGNSHHTPLLTASFFGQYEAVKILIENKADVNFVNENGYSPLYFAVEGNHKAVVEILLDNGANVHAETEYAVLGRAVRNNNKEMVELLLARGADVNVGRGAPLLAACKVGHRNMVLVLLKNRNINVHVRNAEGQTPLHIAAIGNFWNIGKALIKSGAEIDAKDKEDQTPLQVAVHLGRKEFVDVLLENGADFESNIDQLISKAIISGYPSILDKLLHLTSSKVDIQSISSPLIIAVVSERLDIIKVLFDHLNIDINAKRRKHTSNNTLLHVAANVGNIDFVKYFISRGADLQSEDNDGLKPIHLATKNGHEKIIDVFLEHGMSIDESDQNGNTPLHHSLTADMTRHLINKCADINKRNNLLKLAIHKAAESELEEIARILLKNGSVFNSEDCSGKTPRDLTDNKNILTLIDSVEQLFKAVEENNIEAVENFIENKAPVNAKRADNWHLLHIAAKNGFCQVCKILLKNEADPNAIGDRGNVALHYAAEFSQFEVVKLLLSHGAVYNVKADTGNTPRQVSVQQNIKDLLHLIEESFRKVQSGDLEVVNDFRSINDIEIVRAVTQARNEHNKILVNVAIHNNFPQVEEIQKILQEGLSVAPNILAKQLISEESFTEARFFLNLELMERETVLGKDNPNTLDSQFRVADTLFKQSKYSDALKVLKDVHAKQTEGLNYDNEASLRTESKIALVLHQQGNHQLALEDLQRVYKKQNEILTINHRDVLETSTRLAIALRSLARYEEAMKESNDNYARCLQVLEPDDLLTLEVHNIIGTILFYQKEASKAMHVFKSVYEGRKKKLKPNHSDTMRAQHNFAAMLATQGKYGEALKIFLDLYARQLRTLGLNHIDTVNTQRNIACAYYFIGEYREALKFYKDGYELRNTLLGENNPTNLSLNKMFEQLIVRSERSGYDYDKINACQLDIMLASLNNDINKVQCLINDGSDVNTTDGAGRKPLHFAASNGNKDMILLLLKYGADATAFDSNGDTALHAATYKGHVQIIKELLAHVSKNKNRKFNNFINAKTLERGTTVLHIAAYNQALEIVRVLLKYGAIYDILDSENTPLDFATDENVVRHFGIVKELFRCAKSGDGSVMVTLAEMGEEDLQAIVFARNCQMVTALEVALENGHEDFANSLADFVEKVQSLD